MGLHSRARRWRGQYLRRTAVDGAAQIVGASAAGFLILLWLDQVFALGRASRWTCGLALVAGALAGAFFKILRPLLGFRWETVFDRAGAAHPELKDYLK